MDRKLMALSQNEWVGLLPPGTHSSPTTLAFLFPLSNSWLVGCGGVWWASLTDSGWLRLDLPFPSPSLSPLPPPPHIPWKWKLWLWLCKMWNLGDSKKWSFAILLFCFPEFVVTSSCSQNECSQHIDQPCSQSLTPPNLLQALKAGGGMRAWDQGYILFPVSRWRGLPSAIISHTCTLSSKYGAFWLPKVITKHKPYRVYDDHTLTTPS